MSFEMAKKVAQQALEFARSGLLIAHGRQLDPAPRIMVIALARDGSFSVQTELNVTEMVGTLRRALIEYEEEGKKLGTPREMQAAQTTWGGGSGGSSAPPVGFPCGGGKGGA